MSEVVRDALLAAARARGVAFDAVISSNRRTSVRVHGGRVEQLTVAESGGVGVRVVAEGRTGYAYSESTHGDALAHALAAAHENALLAQPKAGADLLPPLAAPPFSAPANRLDTWDTPAKIEAALHLEAAAKAADPRVRVVSYCEVGMVEERTRVVSSRGVDAAFDDAVGFAGVGAQAGADGEQRVRYEVKYARDPAHIHVNAVAAAAVTKAVAALGAQPISSGRYRVVLDAEAAADLIGAFAGMFSGKALEEGKSPLVGRAGAAVAAAALTLIDDPLRPGAFGSRPFDAEGTPARAVTLIDRGRFVDALHNGPTGARAGTGTTGHAARHYKGELGVAPTNLVLSFDGPARTAAERTAGARVLLIDDLAGLHAGVSPVSGDFSLSCSGALYENGARRHAVASIVVSGNILDMLGAVEAAGDDPYDAPPGATVITPSLVVRELSIGAGG